MRPARKDGSLQFSSKVLSCLWEENVSFLSFLLLSPWVLQYEWENKKFGFYPHSLFPSFILHLKGIAGQLYPGPSLGVLTQESDMLRASRSSTRASMGSASVRTSLRRIECATSILLDALETSGDLVYDLQSMASIVLVDGPSDGKIGGLGLPFFEKNGRLRLCFPPDIHSKDEQIPCSCFPRKLWLLSVE